MLFLRKHWSSAAVFLGALAVRLLYLLESRANPFFDAPVVDAQSFLEQARRIAAGDLVGGDSAYWQPPLFPYFLAAFQWLAGDAVFLAVRIGHAALGAFSCLLLHRLALRLLSPLAATLTATCLTMYGPLLYFEAELLAVALEVFLYLLLLSLLVKASERQSVRWWLAAGMVGGLAAVTRPNILLFLLVLALMLPLVAGSQPTKRWSRQLLALIVGLACVIGPVTWRNAAVGGELVLISANGGVNFYIGNNARADSTVAIHPGHHWERLMGQSLEAGYDTPGRRSDYFYRRAFTEIAADPLAWVGLLAQKTCRLFTAPEVKRNQNPYYAREHSRLLSVLLWGAVISFPHGVVIPLALLGLVVTWQRSDAGLNLLRLFLVTYGLSIALFFVTSRYRIPLAPVWLLFAAFGVVWLGDRLGARRWRESVLGLGLVLFAGVVVNLPSAPSLENDAQLQHDLGEIMLRKERYSQSLVHSRRATELEPDYASAFHNMAVAWLSLGQPRSALEASRRALDLYPERPTTRFQYARALWETGDPWSAVKQLEIALLSAPKMADARHELGRWLLRLGQPAEATPNLEVAARLRPDAYWTAYDLGRALHLSGRHREAVAVFARAATLAPSRAEAPSAAGAAALAAGDMPSARYHLREALRIDSTYVPARINVGLVEIEAGNYRVGIELLEDVLTLAPDKVPVLDALARSYAAVGEPSAARRALEAARAHRAVE